MSNSLAISTVTATFARRVMAAASMAIPGANVRVGTPTAALASDNEAVVNLHLYRVERNDYQANAHYPTNTTTGQGLRPSQLALDLHYVLSFYGDHQQFESDRMLASVMLSMEAQPFLTKAQLNAAIGANVDLAASDLADDPTQLRVARDVMNTEDITKLWSIFYQVPYAISLAYTVSHVVIAADMPAPVPLPIARPALWVAPNPSLRLDGASGMDGRLVSGGTLRLTGKGLGLAGLALQIDDSQVEISDVIAQDAELDVPLTPARLGAISLDAGVHRVQVLAAAGTRPAHLQVRSNAVAFALHPQVTPGAVTAPAGGAMATGTLSTTFAPPVRNSQTLRLLLDARDPAKPAHIVLAGRDEVPASSVSAAAQTFAFTDLPRGDYLVRADVDGLISPVEFDVTPGSPTLGQISGPVVTI